MIFGAAGPAGAGKDTVADYLVKHHGFTKMAFADPLRSMMAAGGFPEPVDRALKEALVEGFDFTWRDGIQKLGTQWGRELDPDIWVKLIEKRILYLQSVQQYVGGVAKIVLSDVRFENEANMLRALGGCVLHCGGRRVNLGVHALHISEAGCWFYPDDDELIDNSSSLQELYRQLDAIFAQKIESKAGREEE